MIDAVTAHVHQSFLRVQREKLRAELSSEVGGLAELATIKRYKRARVALLPLPDDVRQLKHLAAAVARKHG